MNNERPGKHNYYLDIALAVSSRSTCLRRQYGAVIVKDDEIVSTGYNGAPRGEQNCSDLGTCPRNSLNIPKGEGYDICVSVHAEQNAIISASRDRMLGSTIYIAGYNADGTLADPTPCTFCRRFIKNAGIEHVIGLFQSENNFEIREIIF